MKNELNSLQEILTYHLEAMYDAEKSLIQALPRLLPAVRDPKLKARIRDYAERCSDGRLKLKRIFTYLLTGPYKRTNPMVDAFVDECRKALKMSGSVSLREMVAVLFLRDVANYRISSYKQARDMAEQIGIQQVVELLDQILGWETEIQSSLAMVETTVLMAAGRTTRKKQ